MSRNGGATVLRLEKISHSISLVYTTQTVLAPTNDAFKELEDADKTLYDALITPPWIAHLQWLLLSHVVSKRFCTSRVVMC